MVRWFLPLWIELPFLFSTSQVLLLFRSGGTIACQHFFNLRVNDTLCNNDAKKRYPHFSLSLKNS